MKRKIILASTLLSSLFNGQVNSGNPYTPTIFSNSPISASLGQFDPMGIDLFTGQPSISFNLFSYTKDNYNLNIDLSYNLSSIKPDIPPTWAGVGWNVNVGGVITRTVKGGIDEVLVHNDSPSNKYSYYDNYGMLDAADWASSSKLYQFININKSLFGSGRTVYPSPDEFNFSVNGMSGTFYKNHKGEWIVASGDFKDIKITSELASDFEVYENGFKPLNSKTHRVKRIIYGFVLTDKKGTQYIFGKTPESIEFSATPYNSSTINSFNTHFIANSWFLTKVILPNKFEITYNYERDNRAFYKVSHSFTSMYYNINSGVSAKKQQGVYINPERTFVTYLKNINVNNEYSINFFKTPANVEEYDYSPITTQQWNESFQYSHHYGVDIRNAKHFFKLDKITIDKSAVIEEINFNYLEDPNKKLYLTGFNKNGQIYSMDYFSTDLPKYNQRKNDHWGYYNNKSFLTSVQPGDGLFYTPNQLKNVLPTYKETDPAQLTKGVLKRVTFPTKGFSEFIFEPHDYTKVIDVKTSSPYNFYIEDTAKKIAGGLRIKRIITDPGDGQRIVKDYFYTENGALNGKSTGVLSGKPVYYEEDQDSKSRIYRFADVPIIQTNNTKGKHIVYTKVIEKVSENGNGGTTEYNFTNSDNGYIDKSANAYVFSAFSTNSLYNNLRYVGFNSLDFERGKPLNIIKKDKNGAIVHQTNFKYNALPTRFDDNIRAYDFQSNVYGEAITDGAFTRLQGVAELIRLSAYNIYSYHPYLSEKEEVLYHNNAPALVQTTKYFYGSNQHNQVTQTEFLDTTGTKNTSVFSYAHEKNNPLMISKNIVGIPLETMTTQTIGNSTKTLSKIETIYPKTQTEANTKTSGLILPMSVLSYDISNLSSPGTIEVTYDRYDSKGNIQQYTTKAGVSTTIIWGYNGTQPIAKIEGAKLSDITQSLITTIVNASNDDAADPAQEPSLIIALDNFRKNSGLSNYQITTYTYDPLVGVTSITPPSGIREVYIYDTANRLKEIRQDSKTGNLVKEFKYNYKN
ncbi:hypothetical protein [Chryseobacterium piperi]|nr:hypothetical protein [Chryseobacterium piperi]